MRGLKREPETQKKKSANEKNQGGEDISTKENGKKTWMGKCHVITAIEPLRMAQKAKKLVQKTKAHTGIPVGKNQSSKNL